MATIREIAEKTEYLLCVGGPRAGERHPVREHCEWLEVPVYNTTPPDVMSLSRSVSIFRYKVETFASSEGSIRFWAPHDYSPLAAMSLLLESYENARKKIVEVDARRTVDSYLHQKWFDTIDLSKLDFMMPTMDFGKSKLPFGDRYPGTLPTDQVPESEYVVFKYNDDKSELIFIAATFQIADAAATIDFGWQRIKGEKAWKNIEGHRVDFLAIDQWPVDGVSGVYLSPGWGKRSDKSLIDQWLRKSSFLFTQTITPEVKWGIL